MRLPDALADLDRLLDSELAPAADAIRAGWIAGRTPALRVNLLRTTVEQVRHAAAEAGIALLPHPLAPWTFTTDAPGEYALKGNPLTKTGQVYLQTLCSQVPVLALDPQPGMPVLDACAAPGGKTSQIAMLAPDAPITAVEWSAVRLKQLQHTLKIQGCTRVTAIGADARSLPQKLRRPHARILVDAPCSGTGTLRPDQNKTWAHLANRYDGYVAIKAQQQLGILRSVASLLTPDGILVYSTCSIDPRENEAVIDAFLKAEPGFDLDDVTALGAPFAGRFPALSTGRDPRIARCLRLHPDGVSEGFFVARLRRA